MPKKAAKPKEAAENLNQIFSKNLRELRGDLSQNDFAKALGIPHQQTYQRYEKGLIPAGDVLFRIAQRAGVSMDQLFTKDGVREVPSLVHHNNFIRENLNAKPINELSDTEVQECLFMMMKLLEEARMPMRSVFALAFMVLQSEFSKRMANQAPAKREKMREATMKWFENTR